MVKTVNGADDDGWFDKEFEKIGDKMALDNVMAGYGELSETEVAELEAVLNASLVMIKTLVADWAEDQVFIANMAKYQRRYYMALIAEGFSEEMALRIVSSKFPRMESS